jgi:predicted XRE-type DNA-binding protein
MATRTWREIRAERSKVTPDRQAAIDNAVRTEVARMHLAELRRARHLSQVQIAETLDMRQGDVSRLERQTDMYLSTLARFVAASGGRLRIVAEYEDADPVEIDVLGEIGSGLAGRSYLTDTAKT